MTKHQNVQSLASRKAPRPRRPVSVPEHFGIDCPCCPNMSLFTEITDCDREAIPVVDPHYVFRPTPETRRVLFGIEHPDSACYLVGPTGCGKTSLVEQACARLNRPVTRFNLDGDLDRSSFMGMMILKEDQSTRFQYGPVVNAVRDGHVLILDEIDMANPNVLACLQACLEGRSLMVPETEEVIPVHPDFRFFATANTVGRGDPTMFYRGTQAQNGALLDRFCNFLHIPYPTVEEEVRILSARFGKGGRMVYEKAAKTAAEIRLACAKGDCEAPMSTRVVIAIVQDMLTHGGGPAEAYRYCFLNRLGDHDREICEKLIHAVWGSGYSGPDGWKALLDAVREGGQDALRWLPATHPARQHGLTGLMMEALAAENEAAVRACLDQGADVNAKGGDNATPALIVAVQRKLGPLIPLFLGLGADVNAVDGHGCTALMHAVDAWVSPIPLMQLLLKSGADVNAASHNGKTALMRAASAGKKAAAELLLAHGADPNARDQNGHTAYHYVNKKRHRNLARSLQDAMNQC